MRTISQATKQIKNKLSNDDGLLFLLDIIVPSNPLFLVRNNEDIIRRRQLYKAFPVEIGTVSEDGTGADSNVTLTLSNLTQGLQFLVEEEKGAVGTPVVLRVVNTADIDGEADIEEFFIITKCKVNRERIEFTLGNGYSVRSRRPLDRYMKNNCRFKYKGIRCGYNGDLKECKHTLADCRKHRNSMRFGGFVGIDRKGVYK